jgi:glycosyltransferase involved in cell wall biosynthesis
VSSGQILVGLPARLDPIKDHETFLRAAALARKSNERLRFVCIGGGDAEYSRRMAALSDTLGLHDAVIWAGERRDMPAVLNALDIVTLTSIGEGLSNAIGEAMASGVPPVVTDVGDMARLVGEAGSVVPVGDARAVADAWLALAADPARRADAGAAARDHICRHYSLDIAAAAMRELFEQVVSEHAR